MGVASLAITLLLAQGYAPGRQGTDPLDVVREERVQKLGKQLRCVVCQGLSIADSPASTARAQLDKVRELVAAGKTDQEVFDFFVERYGEFVLLKPTGGGSNVFLWGLPLLLLLVGLIVILMQVRKNQPPAPPSAPAGGDVPEDPFLAAVRKDLEKS